MFRERPFRLMFSKWQRVAIALWCSLAALQGVEPRPAEKLEHVGLPNLYRVSETLYRCAQPDTEGLRNAAKKLGVKTVINLRVFHSDNDEAGDGSLKLERIPIKTWDLEEKHVVRFLKIVAKTNAGPFLLHCQHGADRTGTMIAVYRMAVQGWSRDAALKEMMGPDHGYHKMWRNLPRFVRTLDVEEIRRKAGLPPKP